MQVMHTQSLTLILIFSLGLVACAPITMPTPIATRPTPPTTTATLPSAEKRAVTFNTSDGVTLNGTLYGQGDSAVIFSNMGDKHEDSWSTLAAAVADEGYLVLTYEFRYWVNGKIDNDLAKRVGDDLNAAVTFVSEQGAQKIALVGASLGGMATAKVAAEQAAAVIIIGSPLEAPSIGLTVSTAELQTINAPKLFITSANDDTVDAAALQEMYDLAVEPKELYVYPGTAHGTNISKTANGPDFEQRIIQFITTHVPATQGKSQ